MAATVSTRDRRTQDTPAEKSRKRLVASAVMPKRSYGSGRLFVYTDKAGVESWYGSWRVGGRRVQRKIGLKREAGGTYGFTRVQAERELRKRIENDLILATSERKTVPEAASLYVDHLEDVMERKRSTIEDYRGYVRAHFKAFFGDTPIDRVDPARVASYLKKKRAGGLSAKTVQNHLNFLHGVFSYSIKRGWAASNPVAHVDRPKKTRSPHRRIRFLEPAELDNVIAAVVDDEVGAMEASLYLAAALTGLRQGELLALKWMDVDWVAGRVRVADNFTRGQMDSPKSHQGRSVPMADRLARELELHRGRSRYPHEEDLVFCHPTTGNVLDPSKLRKRFRQALQQAKVREITFHELRHTFGTQLAAAGVPLRALQEWMGHADAKTTEIYRHYAPDPTNGAHIVERAFASQPSAPRGRQPASYATTRGADSS
jgi:integrase